MRLVGGEMEMVECPTCKGRGKIPCPPSVNTRTGVGGKMLIAGEWQSVLTPGTGHPIPCPDCKGRKMVVSTTPGGTR